VVGCNCDGTCVFKGFDNDELEAEKPPYMTYVLPTKTDATRYYTGIMQNIMSCMEARRSRQYTKSVPSNFLVRGVSF
jgi:hypothetical protein